MAGALSMTNRRKDYVYKNHVIQIHVSTYTPSRLTTEGKGGTHNVYRQQ
jgi:hypothetical protein